MIKKILIANRGEIALRIIRTCRTLNIKSVSIYSNEDYNSLHVKKSTESYYVGDGIPSKSYLNQKKIIEIALSTGSDAIHPGYGFLSENHDFVELCEKNNITFIGPSSKSMRLCGDKMKCKEIMKSVDVPIIPGSFDLANDIDDAINIAGDIGYPVLLKSVYGGGGRGIRLVNNDNELRSAFEIATRESISAFGKSALLVEKFLPKTRHIEFQVASDKHNNTVHIFERECSIQRRHQKLIEMSPSPVVDHDIRNKIGQLAITAIEAVGYDNLGTVEFLRLDDGTFYFIEINARLQVEHPVTELVSGLDLVKLQISIANGETIPFKQKDLAINGCAIECRINAENTFLDFAPSTGFITDVTMPFGTGVRIDTYLYPGCTVSSLYDSLIAKLNTWGQNFEEARARMHAALSDFYIQGIETSIPLYKTIINTKEFIGGNLSTNFLDRFNILDKLQEDMKKEIAEKQNAALAAAMLYNIYYKNKLGHVYNRNINWKNKL